MIAARGPGGRRGAMRCRVRVLLVGGAEDDPRLVAEALRDGGLEPALERARDLAALHDALDREPRDLVIAALDGAGPRGLEVLSGFLERQLDVPFVFLSREGGEGAAVTAIKAGASDFVTHARLERLVPIVERELAQAAMRANGRGEDPGAGNDRHDEPGGTGVVAEATRYVDLYEFAPVGYLTLDGDGRILQVNQTGAELLGRARSELVGLAFDRFVLAPDVDRWTRHLRRAAEGGERRRVELRLQAAHGAMVHVQADSRRVLDVEAARAQGGPAGRQLRVALTDISDRKEAEASMRRFEAKLREVQKMESLGTLAGGVAHDFNNILAAILGNVELARGDLPTGHRALVSLDEIDHAGRRARDLVNQILMFSRREPQELVTQPLQPVMQETQRLLRATLPAGVDLAFVLAQEPLYVHADATQLQQVLMNLCTNAWHALVDGHGRIRVQVEPQGLEAGEARRLGLDGPGDYVHVRVSDTGVGMDPLTQARIFEPFFTTKPPGQGTGLGLSVVHGILAAHHGAIEVESTPGRGSTFHLRFPRVDPAPPPPSLPARGAGASRPGEGEHVVYIDDDETMAVMVERLLERAGYRVTCFTDAAQALVALADGDDAVACVVTDFNMPGISGLDVARTLRDRRPDVPVILSSGYLSDELRSDARDLGVRALLQKQDTVQALADLVGNVMAGSVAG
jgi:PAS domain S-box-containing protein